MDRRRQFEWFWLGEFLNRIEEKELELLNWGIVDAGLTEDELLSLRELFLTEHRATWKHQDIDSWKDWERSEFALIDALTEHALLLEIESSRHQQPLFRSRMAEGVRLFAHLRQLFPHHRGNKEYDSANPLVSDFRLLIRPREYPKRQFDWASLQVHLKEHGLSLNPLQKALLHTMMHDRSGHSLQLADFQRSSTARILSRCLSGQDSGGSIICAGTGSGKTLAFYLPALCLIGERLNQESWVQCLAIYPRNELLKDQLNETYRQARLLDQALLQKGKRKIKVAALFGKVPQRADWLTRYSIWADRGESYVCPFFLCPQCESEMVWSKADIQAKKERLTCTAHDCQGMISEDEVILTRERMIQEPPDLLFTTTEMMNQRLSDLGSRHLFGCGQPEERRPYLLLLDEVHTYFGLNGAQVGNLLRRWRRYIQRPVHFVGLSATLRDAAVFFSSLTGLPEEETVEIAPTELVREGREYLLALRNEPAARASLLSTTIQASMLMRRLMNPSAPDLPKTPFAGEKLFLFTDDLNVTNRLFFALRDAEGWTGRGRPLRNRGTLASLRHPTFAPGNLPQSFQDGQQWLLPRKIGFSLEQGERSRVGRTSSQDAGVESEAEQIVATASLEVGYNDPSVGAVIQHKAPLDTAQFLQRKGRAGRRRSMRPWTVVVMSDYGRDRAMYQQYDRLFSPELPPRFLPVENRYVLRMQAVMALLDWLSAKQGSKYFHGWRLAAGNERQRSFAKGAIRLLRQLLNDASIREDLERWLKSSLQLATREQAHALLWSPPRSLMLHVVPTLLRRLETGWRRWTAELEESKEATRNNHPLPEFIPANLFSDLNLPEVHIPLPPSSYRRESETEAMGVLASLREFAPGRITKRFAVYYGEEMHWLLPTSFQLDVREQLLELEAICGERYDDLGQTDVLVDGSTRSFRLFRPHQLQIHQVGEGWKDSCNAMAGWGTEFRFEAPHRSLLGFCSKLLQSHLIRLDLYAHMQNNAMEARRVCYGSTSTLYPEGNDIPPIHADFRFTHDGKAAALGFGMKVDGLRFVLRIPPNLVQRVEQYAQLKRALRLRLFEDAFLQGDKLHNIANIFQRQWLIWGYLGLLTGTAVDKSLSLEATNNYLLRENRDKFPDWMRRCLKALFRLETDGSGVDTRRTERNLLDLLEICHLDAFIEALESLAPLIWSPPQARWKEWLKRCYITTYGSATMVALERLCSDLNMDSLILDFEVFHQLTSIPEEDTGEFWITESSPGGLGLIEEVADRLRADGKLLEWHLEYSLRSGELEKVDEALSRALDLMCSSERLRTQVRAYRKAMFEGHEAAHKAWNLLKSSLNREHLPELHAFYSSLQIRLLKAGSTEQLDQLLLKLLQRWEEQEERLGVELDVRVYAFLAAKYEHLDEQLRFLRHDITLNQEKRFNIMYSLLWARGGELRSQGLEQYNPYAHIPYVERLLLVPDFSIESAPISTSQTDWESQLVSLLRRAQEAQVTDDAEILGPSFLTRWLLEPIDDGDLLRWPKIRGVSQQGEWYVWDFLLS